METIQDAFETICQRALEARKGALLAAPSTQIVAVSKGQSTARIEELLRLGHRCFAENRVQEACEKWGSLKQSYNPVELRLIGPLQTNKVREAVELFDVIETLDRHKLAEALAKEMQRQGKMLSCLIQVNTGEEEQKAGVTPRDADELIAYSKSLGLTIMGVMCIPPADDNPAQHFALLRQIARRNNFTQLSMGMSGDFETAIRFSATHIRIGTALFGARL